MCLFSTCFMHQCCKESGEIAAPLGELALCRKAAKFRDSLTTVAGICIHLNY